MNLSDTFYIALCMTVLILGVVYWFWTQNQYIQRKLNLLENIVYEMKTTLSNVPEPPVMAAASQSEAVPATYPPAPSSVLGEDEDLLHEELSSEIATETIISQPPAAVAEEKVEDALKEFAIENAELPEVSTFEVEDLQPGGVGSSVKEIVEEDSKTTVLDSMTLSDLKRMADQKGIVGASKMRKQALIDAIRNVSSNTSFVSREGLLELK